MRFYRVLKRLRLILSLIVLIGITYYFAAVRVQYEQWLSPLLKVQFVPALLSSFTVSIFILACIVLITLIFGRIYCSLLCPMGVFQDVVIRISGFFKTKKQRRFKYTGGAPVLRYSILIMVIAVWIAGFTLPLLLLDPYSNYGRMASHLFKPVVYALHNGLHYIFPDAVYYQGYTGASLLGYLLPVGIFVTVAGMSALRGRLFCNTICPVGSFLGLISKYAMFRPVVDKSACNHCGLCSFRCKSECINSKAQQIDYSRCVGCLNCTVACQRDALKYAFSWRKASPQPVSQASSGEAQEAPGRASDVNRKRRLFLASAGGALGAAAVYRFAGPALAAAEPGETKTIAPPGARSRMHLKEFCTACQACVAACPTHIIKPTLKGYGLDGWMLPEITYKDGFCSYDCNRCTQVCPTMALERTTLEEKKLIQIGKAKFTAKLCIVLKDQTDCGACDEHCPTKAVHMVPFGEQGLRKPKVDAEYCIGCGGCEFICPAVPKAIVVHANATHQTALPPVIEEQRQVKVDDFGF